MEKFIYKIFNNSKSAIFVKLIVVIKLSLFTDFNYLLNFLKYLCWLIGHFLFIMDYNKKTITEEQFYDYLKTLKEDKMKEGRKSKVIKKTGKEIFEDLSVEKQELHDEVN